MVKAEKVCQCSPLLILLLLYNHYAFSALFCNHYEPRLTFCLTGGKVKPLKSAKKEKKELDEDEIAFREKQKAGKCFSLGSNGLDNRV